MAYCVHFSTARVSSAYAVDDLLKPVQTGWYLSADIPQPATVDSCQWLALSVAEYKSFQQLVTAANAPFDYIQAAAIFSFFFSFTVGCWVVAKNAGLILEAVKKW